MIKAVIFDMDGLLIDSEPLWTKAYKEAFKAISVTITDDDMREVRGRRQPESVGYFFRKNKVKDHAVDSMVDTVINDMVGLIKSEGKLLPCAKEALKTCNATGLPMAIATSLPPKIIDAVMGKFDIKGNFDHIYSAVDEPYGKPHPGTFISAAKKLSVDPHDVLVFEDAPGGVLAAKAAKMHCIAVPEPALRQDKFILTADLVLNSLEDFNTETLKSF